MSAWREALQTMRMKSVAAVWAGMLLLAGLSVLWLQIPDSHVWQLTFSILFGCGLLALFFWFCTWLFNEMLHPAERERWWVRWLLLAVVIFVWWLLQIPIDRLIEHEALYAGYWTSRLPHGLRGLHTYEDLMMLQDWTYFSLRLIVTGLLLPVAVVVEAGGLGAGVRGVVHLWLRWWYWVAALICGWLAFAISGKLIDWTPGHGLASEMLSLLMRLGFAFTLDVLLGCFVLALIAVGLRRVAVAAN